ncbi:IclR family transcriptional regulator [Saccharopolyspora cebuensis]|uniref:IclR family transcriptional regulator n=1 Tax=Saccharopolyspora cebuensis TaxID=418759 RepID=UPI0031F1AEA8
MPAEKPTSTMRSLERAIDVLEVLDRTHQAVRLSDIARQAGLPVATTQRILNVLEARGRVERDATGYRPGIGMIFGAHAYLTTSPLLVAAHPVLADLAAETGLTASLFRRHDRSRIVLARSPGKRPLRYELPVGERLPLHLGAGKVLLAHMEAPEVDALLDEIGDHVLASGAGVSPDQLRDELGRIRERGFSEARNEREPGMASIAAALPAPGDGPHVAVQVAGLIDDIPPDRVEGLGVEVRRAAYAITRRLA